jgi:hypothetical protein
LVRKVPRGDLYVIVLKTNAKSSPTWITTNTGFHEPIRWMFTSKVACREYIKPPMTVLSSGKYGTLPDTGCCVVVAEKQCNKKASLLMRRLIRENRQVRHSHPYYISPRILRITSSLSVHIRHVIRNRDGRLHTGNPT